MTPLFCMTMNAQDDKNQPQTNSNATEKPEAEAEKILCPHCRRTASNGIKCLGICVADSDY